MTNNSKFSQSGFTIIELLIATTVFSVFLLLLSAMTIRIGQMYNKGVISAKTQEAARAISADIGRSVQFSSGNVTWGTGTFGSKTYKYICAGSQRYSYVLGRQLVDSGTRTSDQTDHVLVSDSISGCSSPADLSNFKPATQKELLPAHMRLSDLTVIQPNINTPLYTIKVRVVYGEADLLSNPSLTTANCSGAVTGTQFCAVSELTTTVEKRL